MAHELEIIDGNASMAYAGQLPWHGLGKQVHHDLTPAQMLKEAGVDWQVEKRPAFIVGNDGAHVHVRRSALVRSTDEKVLDVVPSDWIPLQNEEAFEFFKEFVMEGDMEMHTAGSLKGGQIVWGLARIKDGFFVGKKDEIQSHLLFTNPHQFGKAIDIRFTPIRVVCMNTLSLALGSGSRDLTVNQQVVKSSHRKPFDAEKVKATLGIASKLMDEYEEAANFLASKSITGDSIDRYFREIFPSSSTKNDNPSRNHIQALAMLESQPGHELFPGTWWNAFNTVTYMTDHILGRVPDTRLQSAWFGSNRKLKSQALNVAVDMANA